MARVKHYLQLIIFDTLAVLCMIGALLTGWLPGPGGIPLFIAGLGLLAINHEWAERYIDLLREYADRLGELIFRPRLYRFFDLLSPTLIIWGLYIILDILYPWTNAMGAFMISMGVVVFFGNRNRWGRLKKKFKRKR